MNKTIYVAVAVIKNEENEILISRRQQGQHLAGYWEFPGGKIEQNETVRDALIREIQEELAITIIPETHLIDVIYHYPEKTVNLKTWCCYLKQGIAQGNEGQKIEWVKKEDLQNYLFPPANQEIIKALS